MLIDVREKDELVTDGRIKGSVNIPRKRVCNRPALALSLQVTHDLVRFQLVKLSKQQN